MVSEWEKFNTNRINAAAGSAVAQYYLGRCFLTGTNVARDSAKAVKWLELSAAQGYKEAQRLLTEALAYTPIQISQLCERQRVQARVENTLTLIDETQTPIISEEAKKKKRIDNLRTASELATGVGKDFPAALDILKPYVACNDELASTMYERIVDMQRRNESTADPIGEAIARRSLPLEKRFASLRDIRDSAARGEADAQFLLADSYYYGKNVNKDYALALMWYRNAAEGGHAEAANQIGNCYVLGLGAPTDYEKAYHWFKSAADDGSIIALYNLGMCFRNGWGVTADKTLELDCYRRAAEGGNARAQFEYGKAFYMGYGCTRDASLAREWLTKASAQGMSLASVMLAKFYEDGFEVAVDHARALELLQQVAQKGGHEADAALAKYYFQGLGVERDLVRAATLARASATAGDIANQRLLAKTLEQQGKYGEAFHWTLLSAREYDGESLCELGRFYFEGKGTAPNTQEAFRSFKAAVDIGCTGALIPLANCYKHGLGVSKNIEEATRITKLVKQAKKNK